MITRNTMRLCVLAAVGLLAFCGSAARADLITDVTAYGTFTYDKVSGELGYYAVDGSGMTGDTAAPHSYSSKTAYFTYATGGAYPNHAALTIDLKKNYVLDTSNTLKVWNLNATGGYRGIKVATFEYSLDGLHWTAANYTTDATTTGATFDEPADPNAYNDPNLIGLTKAGGGAVTARYVRITSVQDYATTFTGLDEVRVFGTLASDPNASLGDPIAVSNVTGTASYDGINRPLANLANGVGLTGMSLSGGASGHTEVFSALGKTAHWDFDLGASQALGAMRVWNYNDNQYNSVAGMRTVDVLVSDNGTDWTAVLTKIELTGAPYGVDNDAPMILDLGGVTGQYVRISNEAYNGDSDPTTWLNWGTNSNSDAQYTGLGKVQFFASVPEPATVAFLGAGGLAMIGGAAARRRKPRA